MGRQAEPSLLQLMDECATYVAAVTGIKQQLLDAGWSDAAAEQIVIRAIQRE